MTTFTVGRSTLGGTDALGASPSVGVFTWGQSTLGALDAFGGTTGVMPIVPTPPSTGTNLPTMGFIPG